MKYSPHLNTIKTHEIRIGLEGKATNRKTRSMKIKVSFGGGGRGRKARRTVSINKTHGTRKADNRQLCSVMTSFRKTKAIHIKNLDYIQKEGKAENGEKLELYGSDTEEFYKKNMDDMSWRIILSPESNKVDLNTFTKEFVKRLENLTGFKFTWIAANHYDTDNHHTHLLINGKDKNGKTVKFLPPDIVKKCMRDYARDICTNLIGEQTQEQKINRISNQIHKSYFTSIDRTIENYMNNNEMKDDSFSSNKNAIFIQRRLQFLIDLELIEYDKKKKKYLFKEDWKKQLQRLGKYNTYQDGLKYAQCQPEDYTLHDVSKDGPIQGTVLHKYILQKDSNVFAVIIKKEDGKSCYVPLPFYPKDCKVNDFVKIEMKDNKKTYIHNFKK